MTDKKIPFSLYIPFPYINRTFFKPGYIYLSIYTIWSHNYAFSDSSNSGEPETLDDLLGKHREIASSGS